MIISKTHIVFRSFSLLIMLLISTIVFSQSGYTLYGLDQVPQSNHLNPAFRPDAKMVIGIPFLSSFSLNAYSTSFTFNDLFIEKGDSLYFDLASVINNASENNYVTASFEMDIIYFGHKVSKGFLTAGIKQRVYARAFYATDFLKLAWYGNNPYVGQQMNLSATWVNSDHFNSWYVGYAFPIGKIVELGVRLNLNQGISNIQTQRSNLQLLTEENPSTVYGAYAQTDYLINTSNISYENGIMGSLFDFNNIGLSLDIGAAFQVHEQVKINVSVLDIGYISWKSELTSYEGAYQSVYFTGVYGDVNDEDEDIFQMYSDTLKSLFKPNEFSQSYSAMLPMRTMVGAEYYFNNDKMRASFLFSGRFMREYFEPSFALGYDMKVTDVFAFKVNYTYLRYSPFNLGVGLIVEARPFQFYVMTDNIISPFNLYGSNYLNIQFGFNLIWPRKDKSD